MDSPFDEPDVQRLLRAAGAEHRPGLADELLAEIGPLLAADGFDLTNLGTSNLDEVNAALGRAVDRRNFERFVPVGHTRAEALVILRQTAELISDGDTDAARALIAGIEPEPVGPAPSIANVIGVSLSILDTWHTDPHLSNALRGTRIPAWDGRSRAAATDVLALAGKGRAFDSLGGLHGRHSGLAILHGSILAITGSLEAWAAHEHTTVTHLAATALTADTDTASTAPRTVDVPRRGGGSSIVVELEEAMRPEAVNAFRNQVVRARLDEAGSVNDVAKAAFVRPFQWMLEQVAGGGIRLTTAGYLPPAVVSAAMAELGWEKDWIGKRNREDLTLPVLDHRESMMSMRLLHRRKGILLPTPLGRRLTGDTAALWDYAARAVLLRPSEVEVRATEFFLLALAAGDVRTHNEYSARVAEGLWSIGWVDESGRQIRTDQAFNLFADTWRTLRRLGAFHNDGTHGSWGPATTTGIAFARHALTQPAKP